MANFCLHICIWLKMFTTKKTGWLLYEKPKKVKNGALMSDGSIRISNVRFSYPHVVQPYESTNDAGKKTKIIRPGPDYDTSAIEDAFLVFVHTDASSDIRDLPGFTPVAKYAGMTPMPKEIGSCEEFRFILSAELASYADAGGANSALYGTTSAASNIDVYPFIICGEDAVFDIALKGEDSFDMNIIPHTQIDKNDLLGQRGYCGASFWSAVGVVNNGWMAVIESGVSALS